MEAGVGGWREEGLALLDLPKSRWCSTVLCDCLKLSSEGMANWQFHCCLLLSRAAAEAILASHILIVIENYEIKTQGREMPVEADERDGKLNGLRRNVINQSGERKREGGRRELGKDIYVIGMCGKRSDQLVRGTESVQKLIA